MYIVNWLVAYRQIFLFQEQMVRNQTSSINSANSMPLTNAANYVPLSTWISGHSCVVWKGLQGFRLWGQGYLGRNQLRGLVCRTRRISLRGLDLNTPRFFRKWHCHHIGSRDQINPPKTCMFYAFSGIWNHISGSILMASAQSQQRKRATLCIWSWSGYQVSHSSSSTKCFPCKGSPTY